MRNYDDQVLDESVAVRDCMHMLERNVEGGWGGVFFFQAEDGIRDLVRSRGLGDVYKRQHYNISKHIRAFRYSQNYSRIFRPEKLCTELIHGPVSYTHLTLPTSDLV